MSQQQLEVAKANYESAAAQVSAAQAQVQQAQAQVTQRSAAVKVAETNLSHTTIHAPIDGTVVSRNVDVGQTVAASLQAPTLFTIAQDLTKMQVYAKTDESDVGQIKVGQRATFKVDAFPRETFSGTVTQVRMNPTTVQNVVTYDTVVDFANPELKLFPGMTAYIDIPVATANNALKIPNAALRYKPDLSAEQVQALYKQYGIDPLGGGGRRRERAAAAGGAAAPGGEAAGAGGQQQEQRRRPVAQPEGQPGGGEAEQAQEERAPRDPRPDIAILWKMRADKTLEPVKVRTGITDYTNTELAQLLQGELKEGDQLVTGSTAPARQQTGLPGTTGPQRRR
jgi:HlyD family secretion protein